MEYKAFALKYRPQDFDDVVGQQQVVSSLKSAILKKRVHHAYLFTGPRGIGKTSLARIFSKALNCEKGSTITPCGKCSYCVEITKGTSLDVIEIDGASNRGIDEVRALRESVKLSTVSARYKIYIIDEVHMLTQEAFNALLKTLEEPPAHVKFIFATTHPQKILPTILSRCQKFQFNLLSLEDITKKLESIVKQEKITIDASVLYAVARTAQGSIRDAESLLDQIVPVVLEKKNVEDLFSFLGIIDEEAMNTMVGHIFKRDVKSALAFLQKMIDDGKDIGIFLNSVVEHLRNLLLAKVSTKTFTAGVHLSPHSKEYLRKQAQSISAVQIIEMIDLFIEAKDLSRKLNSIRIPFELALIKFCLPQESQRYHTSAASQELSSAVCEKEPVREPIPEVVPQKPVPETKVAAEEDQAKTEVSVSKSSSSTLKISLTDIKMAWPKVIVELGKTKASLSAYLSEATPQAYESGILHVGFLKKDAFHKEVIEQTKNLTVISDVLSKYIGLNIGIQCGFLKDGQKSVQDSAAVDIEEVSASDLSESEDDFINELLNTFDAKFSTDDG